MKKIYRGQIYNPVGPGKCDVYEDGGIFVVDGMIEEVGEFGKIEAGGTVGGDTEIEEIPGVIVPAFCDLHMHWVQNKVKGSFGGALLPWLKEHIWPEEANFKNENYTREACEGFLSELAEVGTKAGIIYSSVHKEATEIAIEALKDKGHFVVGNVLMDQNSPEYLQVSTEKEIELVRDLATKYGQKYAVTPRFAPTCTMELMKAVGEIAQEHGCFVQTHLSENKDEIAWVKELFPDCESYTQVYEKAGLLGERTVLGHCIHLDDSELEILRRTGTKVAHCPSSNIALESGRMPVEKYLKFGIPFALATDIGAGPKLDMRDVMEKYMMVHNEARKEQQARWEASERSNNELEIPEITFEEAVYRATLAGAEIMGISDKYGKFEKGRKMDYAVVER